MSTVAEKQLQEALKYVHEATKAITGLTRGGSENFGKKIGPYYTADLSFCVQKIRDRQDSTHKHLIVEIKQRKALEDENERLKAALESMRAVAMSPPVEKTWVRRIDAILSPGTDNEPTT